MDEQWKDIPGYEGLYQASNLGRIKTCDGKTTSNSRYEKRVWKQRIMKQKLSSCSKGRFDYRIELWKDGKHKTWLVARLIALTWCDGYEDGLTVNHIDGNNLNNNASNLEWVTLAKNIQHGFKTGLYSTQNKCVLIAKDGEKKYFCSQTAASKYLGRNCQYVSCCISKSKTIKSANGQIYQIKRGTDL